MKMSDRFGLPLDSGIVTGGATVKALAQAVKEKLDDAGLEYPPTISRSERVRRGGRVESKIMQILAGVIGTDEVGLDDDFFDFGGTSYRFHKCSDEDERLFRSSVGSWHCDRRSHGEGTRASCPGPLARRGSVHVRPHRRWFEMGPETNTKWVEEV